MVKRLLILNGIATLAAVIHHAVFWDVTAMIWWADQYLPVSIPYYVPIGGVRFQILHVVDQITITGVFAFLFVSGYFISVVAGKQRKLSWSMIIHRVRSLLIPYLLWSAIIMIFYIIQGTRYSLVEIIKLLLTGGVSAPYFYVIVLVQLYILSPLLVRLANDHWVWLVGVVLLLQIPVTIAHYSRFLNIDTAGFEPIMTILRDWQLLGYAFWFVWGLVVGFNLEQFKGFLIKIKPLLIILLVLTFVICWFEWGYIRSAYGKEWVAVQVLISGKLFAFLLLLSYFAFDKIKIPFTPQFVQLAPKSYGVYLIHVLVLEITARGIYHLFPKVLAYQVIFLPILIVAGLGVPLIMMSMVNRSPKIRFTYNYIFG